jgi:glucokinase
MRKTEGTPAPRFHNDPRIVLTLDAGGTTFEFSAIRGHQEVGASAVLAAEPNSLDKSLANLVRGFETIRQQLPEPPVAISFAFPGPADYPRGIVANVGNLPAFRGGVPLGPMLEDRFGIPVFLNNDGDLFTYGEALSGFLPFVNRLLEEAGSSRRYRNLVGLTLGTGLGGGAVIDGRLVVGDNSAGGEVWLLRNKLDPETDAEEGASIRAVKRTYARAADIPFIRVPEPKEIYRIGRGESTGNREAAGEAFRRLGDVAGDVLAQALTLIDGLAVIGGGLSAAHPLFMTALVQSMNSSFRRPSGSLKRLIPRTFNLEDPLELRDFLTTDVRSLPVPGSERTVPFDALPRTAVGLSRLGTARAVSVGAYAFALDRLDSADNE